MRAVINSIKFGPMGEDDIRALAVMEITSHKIDEPGSVSDPRLGIISMQTSGCLGMEKNVCITCKLDESKCPGHIAFIALKYPIIHPLFSKYVLKILRIFCYNCGRFMLMTAAKSYPHFDNIVCEKTPCPHCCSPQPTWSLVEDTARIKFVFSPDSDGGRDIFMLPSELRISLTNLNKQDLSCIGITQYPEHFIITLLPICPPCARPPLYIDGQLHDDHLTIQYNEIVKINTNLPEDQSAANIADVKKLVYKITNLYVKKGGGTATIGTMTKPVIKRLSGKKGHMRDSIMGKRVEKSGRTVIGPEPTLLINQIGIPEEMARVLTLRETVTEYNINYYNSIIRICI